MNSLRLCNLVDDLHDCCFLNVNKIFESSFSDACWMVFNTKLNDSFSKERNQIEKETLLYLSISRIMFFLLLFSKSPKTRINILSILRPKRTH